MKPVFIFADQVRSILKSGKKEIEMPDGARISSAAHELIKDNRIRVKTIPPKATVRDSESEVKLADAEPQNREESHDEPAIENVSLDLPTEASGKISEEALEDIVDRVIARFKQLKGLKPSAATTDESVGVDNNADQAAEDDLVICRCEEITRGEIKEAIRNGMRTLNGVKRITRAGMGLCQGQTCQRLVAQILTEELRLGAAEIDPTTARGPVRPLRLEVFANS